MKQKITFAVFFMLLMVLVVSSDLAAQDWDYLDVAPGYETLNKAVLEDLSAPANRVYRLQRDGLYLLNGTIQNNSAMPLRIFAAEGEGARPMIMTTADLSGANYRAFALTGDGHFKNLYISGRSNLGIYTDDSKDMIRLQEVGLKMVIDGCFLEHEWKDFVRMNAKDQKVIVMNSILRNAGDLADGSDNQYFDTRSNDQDTIMIVNSTLYTNTGRGFRTGGTGGAYFRNFIMDHVTVYQVGNGDGARGRTDEDETPLFDTRRAHNVSVTNCLFMDVAFHGDEINTYTIDDTLDYPVFGFMPLDMPELTDDSRNIVLKNNALGVTAELQAYYTQVDSLKPIVFLNDHSINSFFNMYPSWIQENNFTETVSFSDAPTPEKMVAYTTYLRNNDFIEENVPEFWADRNGIGESMDTYGPSADEYDFDYNTDATSYTAGDGGFPVGDLNWFPDKKAEWETWLTDVEDRSELAVPYSFNLDQNFPNPFNPSTTITYSITRSTNVSLEIFDILGRRITTLVNNRLEAAGNHHVTWNGLDLNSNQVASGVYIYQLSAENTVISKKMLLMR